MHTPQRTKRCHAHPCATALTAHFTHQETRAREVVTCQRSESQEEAGRFLPEDHLFSNWE